MRWEGIFYVLAEGIETLPPFALTPHHHVVEALCIAPDLCIIKKH
jgi:hypothetical protein